MRVERIGIISRRDTYSLKVSSQIYDFLKDRVEVTTSRELGKVVGLRERFRLSECDVLVVVGGDGTILRTLHLLDVQIPLMGVNTGEIGFLAEVGSRKWKSAIEQLLQGDFIVEEHSRIEASADSIRFPPSMNEVVIVTAHPAKMLGYTVRVNGEVLDTFRADGVIFATPTGSTAYAMSSGGPIVDPSLNAIIVVPLAPFKLSARPWVVPDSSLIEFEMEKRGREAIISVDGQVSRRIRANQKVVIRKSESSAYFVSLGKSFYEKMKDKIRKIY